jgi:hypothetical protein
MKKGWLKSTLGALMLASTSIANAQEFSKVEVGLQFSPLIGWMNTEQQFMTGGSIGLGYEYGINTIFNFKPNIGLSTGLFINQQGAKLTYDRVLQDPDDATFILIDDKYNFRPNLMYVRIPLTLKMITNEIGYMRYYGLFGPDISILASSRMRFSGTSSRPLQDLTFEEQSYKLGGAFNPLRLGLVVGGGVHYSIAGTTSLVFGIQYNNSFVNQIKDDFNGKLLGVNQTGNETEIKTESKENGRMQFFSLNVGILF